MKQPAYYSGKSHSFLNAASFKGGCTNYQLAKLLLSQKLKGCDSIDKAEFFVGYYCHINKHIKRPCSLTKVLLLNKV